MGEEARARRAAGTAAAAVAIFLALGNVRFFWPLLALVVPRAVLSTGALPVLCNAAAVVATVALVTAVRDWRRARGYTAGVTAVPSQISALRSPYHSRALSPSVTAKSQTSKSLSHSQSRSQSLSQSQTTKGNSATQSEANNRRSHSSTLDQRQTLVQSSPLRQRQSSTVVTGVRTPSVSGGAFAADSGAAFAKYSRARALECSPLDTHSPARRGPGLDRFLDLQLSPAPAPRQEWGGRVGAQWGATHAYFPAVQPLATAAPSEKQSAAAAKELGADQVLSHLGIDGRLYDWRERIRSWLAARVVREASATFSLAAQPVQQQATPTGAAAVAFHATHSGPTPAQQQQSRTAAAERYLRGLDRSARPYVRSRIDTWLSAGEHLYDFAWNGGGEWKGQRWTQDLPTDSQVVVLLFCGYMDNLLGDEGQATAPFTDAYLLRKAQVERQPTLAIVQKQLHDPHYDVLFEEVTYRTAEGRNTVFDALLLFSLLVKRHKNGYLGHVNLASRSIGLMDVLYPE